MLLASMLWALIAIDAVDKPQRSSTLGRIKVGPDGRFVDELGRVRNFHGVNVVEKLAPYYPQRTGFDVVHSLSDVDAANLASWGFNAVRLGVLWVGVVPEPGKVNASYLDEVAATVDLLASHGIWTLIDMHQDAMAAGFCGEGVPSWAIDEALAISGFNTTDPASLFPAPFDWPMDIVDGVPSLARCCEHPFFNYYLTKEGTAAREAIFASPTMWDRFGDHWEAIARRFHASQSVLGYELINEPFSASPFTTDARELQGLYAALSRRIRSADNDTIVFYEPLVGRGQLGVATDFPFGGPGGEQYNDRQAFSYHIYCFNESRPLRVLEPVCDIVYALGWFAEQHSRVGGGRFLTEFGAVPDDAVSIDGLRAMLRAADRHQQSWAYWNFKSYDDITTAGNPNSEGFYRSDGSLQEAKLAALTRPYAPAVAGAPSLTQYNDKDGTFTLRYTPTPNATGPTTIFKHKAYHFPRGFTVTISPTGAARWVATSDNFIEVHHNETAALRGRAVEIEVVVRRV